MVRRLLSNEERALWNALTRSVRPLRAQPISAPPLASPPMQAPREKGLTTAQPARPVEAAPRMPTPVLDNSWEKHIRGGNIIPDMSVDLHGHTLSAAHVRLNQVLGAALSRDARVLLVVTGKPRKTGGMGADARRGAIRREIGHWLETSPHADRIASVRVAHPRHGGDGALYLILRRKK
ncbi:DNA-nicking Smr family endonuclease [Sphingobium sp. OAS761]|uniref:Smr/MutS family protein n=1 Tax=Sphingobium sp. OAS761 TaxID=2817901 RepID=UPI00209D5828|nr:Smr/MutS family protein [Sphingobium sp. OAS761]MCP1468357.1 DNA-nicking Smr family endonuclease [Sphingobium sp. OAS761]